MTQTHPADVLDALRRYDTPTVANAIETLDVRPWNEGFMAPQIRCIFPEHGVMLGYAMTGRIRSRKKAADAYAPEAWHHAILEIPAPRVIVLQDLDDEPCGAFWGEVQSNVHRALGCIGTVTNGGVRDLSEVRPLRFHYFAGSIMVSHAYVHLVDWGGEVEVGGVRVQPGDLVMGDQHGVELVPHEVAATLPAAADAIIRKEREIIALANSPEFTIEKLAALRRA